MEEYEDMRPLDKLLIALKEHEWVCIADDVSDSLIVIDKNGDPHECWDGGGPDHVNVVVAMTIDDALTFFANPLQIADAERMFKANVDKNNDIADLLSENGKLRELAARAWRLFTENGAVHSCDLPEVDAVRDGLRELGVEVP